MARIQPEPERPNMQAPEDCNFFARALDDFQTVLQMSKNFAKLADDLHMSNKDYSVCAACKVWVLRLVKMETCQRCKHALLLPTNLQRVCCVEVSDKVAIRSLKWL